MKIKLSSTLRVLFIAVVALISIPCNAQPGEDFYKLSSKLDTLFVKNQMIVRNAARDTLEVAAIKNGKKNGKQTLFHNNGEVNRVAYFKNDLLSGKVEYYRYGSKFPFKLEHYKALPKEGKSVLHGVYKTYYKEELLTESLLYKDGAKSGKYELYHHNGKLKEKGTFQDNLNIGRKLTYTPEGVLVKDENYVIINNPNFVDNAKKQGEKNGATQKNKEISHQPEKLSVLHGKAKYYYSKGSRSAEFQFKHGKKEGLCKEYYDDKNNSLKSQVVFKNGLEHGAFTYYRHDGNLERRGIYYREIQVGDTILKNVYDGIVEIYQDQGKLHRMETWKNYKKNGVQESYNYKTGVLSERAFFVDNLKNGIEQRFDTEGNKTYEVYYEVVEKEGTRISQKKGTETYWDKNGTKTTVEWENGLQNGASKSYYANGQLEKIMHFKDGKLDGRYQTFYENGNPKEDLNKTLWKGSGNPENLGWNTTYDESGKIKRKFYALGNSKNIVEYNFENGIRKELNVNNVFSLNFSEVGKLSSVQWQSPSRPMLTYHLFSNQMLRRILFSMLGNYGITANFTSTGDLIQMVDLMRNQVNDLKSKDIAQGIARQYNPNWENEDLATEAFPNGNYQWNYADGSPFFKIQFTDNFPQGEWIVYNPVLNDTLFYCEFIEGLPAGKLVRKRIDGTLELREDYYPNNKLKESYQYTIEGIISRITKNDSTGTQILTEEFYPDGALKSRQLHLSSSYFNFSNFGDTLSYSALFVDQDSIRIMRQFFEGNKLRSDQQQNLRTGLGFYTTYFESGLLQSVHEKKDKVSHGDYKKFNENGTLQVLGSYKEGKQHGEWIYYKENGESEVTYYENGVMSIERLLENVEEGSCRCLDTSLPSSKIGFANMLKYLADFKAIKHYIPKSMIPVNGWDYDKIFYLNIITNNSRRNGSTSLKLLLFNDFSFCYPDVDYLKFNLNPCGTKGHIGNFEANVFYDFEDKQIVYAELSPKRISISLEKNPLVIAKDTSVFTAYFDTELMLFREGGIESIRYPKERNSCFPLGSINDFMEIQITDANLEIQSSYNMSASRVPLLPKEINQFYGLDISAASISFTVDSQPIKATCERILAGSNFVAGRIKVQGTMKNENDFVIEDGKGTVNIKNLVKTLEQNGFYRVKAEVVDQQLMIDFYAEK